MAHVLVVRMTVREGEQEHAAELIGRLAEATRQEPGNVHYITHRAVDDPRVFMFYEQYADKAAFEAHGASEHFQSIAVGELFPLQDGERERTFYETLDQ
jgi:quinol monooxygenase YgiN